MLNYRDPKATKVTMKGDWVYRGGRRLGYVHHQGFGRSAGSKSWRFGVDETGTYVEDGYTDRQSAIVGLVLHTSRINQEPPQESPRLPAWSGITQ